MPANRLPLPPRSRRATPLGKQGTATPCDVATIESDRNRLVGELMRLRKIGDVPARPLQTALVLLTSKWSEANWRARERLVKAAEWLLRLESQRSA